MLPDVVTFWHGPLDRLRQLCLRSQVAAGHKVTVYSFEPLTGLPDGVGNAGAEAILPHSFAERLARRVPAAHGATGPRCSFPIFSGCGCWRARRGCGLTRTCCCSNRSGSIRQNLISRGTRSLLGNSVLYLPPDDAIVAAFTALMSQHELTPDWLALRHRLTFALHRLRGRSSRVSDIRVALYGPAALTALARRSGELHHALPKKSFYAVHAEPKLFFDPQDFSALTGDPDIIGLHISPKGRGNEPPAPGSLYAWATGGSRRTGTTIYRSCSGRARGACSPRSCNRATARDASVVNCF